MQNHVDLKNGPGVSDPYCGDFTYNGHEGVDLRVATLAALERFKPVVRAMADGVVATAVDARLDLMLGDGGALSPGDCGNGVTIDHGEGWITQYCHLAFGSLLVKPGEPVQRGQPIARMGVSGAAGFPHLHVAVKRGLIPVDPFTGRDLSQGPAGCGANAAPLWRADSGLRGYAQGPAVLGLGLTSEAPLLDEVKTDPAKLAAVRAGEKRLYVWAHLLGARPEDEIRMGLIGPDGRLLADESWRPERASGVFFAHMGVLPEEADLERWPLGRYGARLILSRGGAELLREEAFIEALPSTP